MNCRKRRQFIRKRPEDSRRDTICGVRRSIFWILFALPLGGAELKIDHVTLAGANLEEMRRAFAAATGIGAEYGGAHANKATEMALASFPDGSYLELIAIQKNADPKAVQAHVWRPFLRENAGPCAFAIHVSDVAAEIRHFTSLGIHSGTVEKSGRTRPDGVALSWETADAGHGPRGSVLPFLIRDFTQREKRVYPSGKPTTTRFGGVALIVIGVRDLEATVALYRKAFDLPEPKRQRDEAFGAELAWFGETPVALATALKTDSWLATRIKQFGDGPAAVLLAGAPGETSPTTWFGKKLYWFTEPAFGWRIGAWR